MEIDKKYLKAYFGRSSSYYIKMYDEYMSGNRFTFNTGAWLASLFWFLYRKMYIQGILIYLGVSVASGLIEILLYDILLLDREIQQATYFPLNLVFLCFFGFTGNYFYLKKSNRVINKVLTEFENEEERIQLLKRKGGTSWAPFVLVIFIIVLLYLVNNYESLSQGKHA